MTYSNAPVFSSNIEAPDFFGFSDYCIHEEIQAEIFDPLFDSVRSDNLSDEYHPNDLKDLVRNSLNYPIREPHEHQYLRWVLPNHSIH